MINRLVVYKAPIGAIGREDFSVSVRTPGGSWEELFVYEAKVDMHQVRPTSMVYFDMEGTVEVMIVCRNGPVNQAVIRPLSANIPFDRNDNVILFALDRPRKLSIEINGERFDNLHLFANPMEENAPWPYDPNVLLLNSGIHRSEEISRLSEKPSALSGNVPEIIYFAPGIHVLEENVLSIQSNTTVYIAGGAIVAGSLVCERVENVVIRGRGILYMSDFLKTTYLRGVQIRFSKHISVEGIITLDPPHYSIYIGKSEHVRIRNFKSFSTRGWCDGIDMMASSHIDIDDVFLRTSDDCIAIYGSRGDYQGDTRHVRVRNSVLWADVAHALNMGIHGDHDRDGDVIEDIAFENIDILEHHEPQVNYWGAMSINAGDKNTIRNVTYDAIRVEEFELGQLLDIRVVWNKDYNPAAGNRIENITFRNIAYNGANTNPNRIHGFDAERVVEGVRFINLRINGELILNSDKGNFDINEYAYGISFSE
ncbi:glycosyl hydrolase family 28 protein [Cohnella suwonensis]|uniref:Glycosyl hydrolase family 28 protein n=1 Tax=Cohnella suwonensis TaxID=696072 RepID=A0ABW0LQ15_9BACL